MALSQGLWQFLSVDRELVERAARQELRFGSISINHIGPLPRILSDQLPAVTSTRVVLCQQDVARMDHERPATSRLEL